MSTARTRSNADLGSGDESSARLQMEKLLYRYPDLYEKERQHLTALIKAAPIVDMALVSSDPIVGDKYRRFRSEQSASLRPTIWETAKFLAFWCLPLALILWAVIAWR